VSPAAALTALSSPVVTQADPTTVIILPARAGSDDPAATAVTEAVRQSTLRALRAMPSIHVVEVGSAELAAIVPSNAGPLGADNLVYLAVTRRREGRVVAEISEQTAGEGSVWSLHLSVQNGQPSRGIFGSIGRNSDSGHDGNAEILGVRFARLIAQSAERAARGLRSIPLSSRAAADLRNDLLDASRSEDERLRTMTRVLGEPLDEGLYGAALAAGAEIATRSASRETRQRAWALLRHNAHDPTLVQPMSYALLSDEDHLVRLEAALGLGAYLDDIAASSALAHASRNDPSPEVRLAAQMATMSFDEKRAFRQETLFDRSLTPAERLAPTLIDNNRRFSFYGMTPGAATSEEAVAFADILAAAEDPALKLRALSELQRTAFYAAAIQPGKSSADEAKVAAALIDTARHADETVRRQALFALMQMRWNADARAELQSVVENDSALAAELDIADTLVRAFSE
jgi:hypothetical protein